MTNPPPPSALSIDEVAGHCARILDEIERAVVGKRDVLELMLLTLLADGHVLIEDLPGLAKTLMARSIGSTTGLDFSRVQFTPDLMPMDVTGAPVLDRARGDERDARTEGIAVAGLADLDGGSGVQTLREGPGERVIRA